ncbi:MAG: sigma-70 family RNA polymerase sigma factor [Myxococcales bacterium]|nr:MAG: sigma-70 family RNA polymerase sigma factor [Myxococcales bacterium]
MVSPAPTDALPADVTAIFRVHADFVWKTLQRLGVPEGDLEDTLQEVFLVVHRRLDTFDGSSQLTTWLYGIARRVAAGHRRKGYRRHERSDDAATDATVAAGDSPEQQAATAQAQRQLQAILDAMDMDRRAAFVMFELDGMSCPEIAAVVGVPVGTVYSRIHAARAEFERLVARAQARRAP